MHNSRSRGLFNGELILNLKVIQAVKPHIVVVELCPSRIHIMEVDEKFLKKEAENLNFAKMLNIIKQNGAINGIVMIMFLTITAQLVNQFGMAPGGEFRAALTEVLFFLNFETVKHRKVFELTYFKNCRRRKFPVVL